MYSPSVDDVDKIARHLNVVRCALAKRKMMIGAELYFFKLSSKLVVRITGSSFIVAVASLPSPQAW